MARRALRKRKPGSRVPKKQIAVLAEGSVTEVEYLRFVRQAMGVPCQLVSIRSAQHTDAEGIIDEVVQERIQERKKSRAEEAKGRAVLVGQWWVVLDTECRPSDVTAAIKKATGGGIFVAFSDSCFEF